MSSSVQLDRAEDTRMDFQRACLYGRCKARQSSGRFGSSGPSDADLLRNEKIAFLGAGFFFVAARAAESSIKTVLVEAPV